MVGAGLDHGHGLRKLAAVRSALGACLAVGVATLAACTGGGSQATPTGPTGGSGASTGASLSAVCRDYAAARTATLAMLDRLEQGTEPVDTFADDGDQLDLTARHLYADVAPLAGTQGAAFRLVTSLSTDMFHVIFGEFQEFRVIDPADVDPRAITELRADFDEVDGAIASSAIPCDRSG